MEHAFVALGANLGSREATLRGAVAALDSRDDTTLVAGSALLETDPVGYLDQPRFLNAVILIETELEPRALLDVLLGIERELGRTRGGPRHGPRTIDLDLLLYGGRVIDEPGLAVPHPRMHERRFVLEPLAEIAPELEIPGQGRVSDLLLALEASTLSP